MSPSKTPSDDENVANNTAPSFMEYPEEGGLCCSGSQDNCKLCVDQMMFGMVNNAMSSEVESRVNTCYNTRSSICNVVSITITRYIYLLEGDFIFGYNHKLGLENVLFIGYRGPNLDVCSCNGMLQFCHNICGKLFL